MNIRFRLNNREVEIEAPGTKRLLDVLREDMRLTAAKEGCGEGECGACSVLKDGKVVNSCLIPVAAVQGCDIITLEAFRETDRGRCIVDAFSDTGAVQCGFCTPGMVMAAESLLQEYPRPTEEEIRIGLSGNLCRCTGYDMIVQGIQLAAQRGEGLW